MSITGPRRPVLGLLGRRPGMELADRCDIPIVHVTAFNQLMWDNGLSLGRENT